MGYAGSVDFLYKLGNELKPGAKWDLARIGLLLTALGNPQRGGRFVHVAGTNGKGSVSAMLASMCRQAGLRTGLYTSPHLVEPRERIQIDGHPVTESAFVSAFDAVHRAAETFADHPSYFETITAMAFLLLQDCDLAVIEVGLGGRLDATNVIDPELTVVTPISFDHEAFLGNTLEAIASEKAGILKPGVPVVVSEQQPEVMRVLESTARGCAAPMVRPPAVRDVKFHPRGCTFSLNDTRFSCPLAGRHQLTNARTAIAAAQCLGLETAAIRDGLSQTVWPGRLEFAASSPDIVLDGAHNPAGAQALARYIEEFCRERDVWLILGLMRDKAVLEISEALLPLAHRVLLTAPDVPRALRPEALAETLAWPGASTVSTLEAALAEAAGAPPSAIVFVTGSLFLVGEARRTLKLA